MLEKLAKKSFFVKKFINVNRQTNRGLYALFCGKYPNMFKKNAKADFIITYGTKDRCLPQYLSDAGMETFFLQAANMSYMRKDLFTQKIGFKISKGNEDYPDKFSRNNWGLHDGDLYKMAEKNILELNKQNQNWFMAMLTVSTHHPFKLPTGDANYVESINYADKSLFDFLKRGFEKGYLKDTLVLLTSDESGSGAREKNILLDNWGLMVAIGKGLPQGYESKNYFTQADVPISILDYLGLTEGTRIGGRSFFREYKSSRIIYFSNFYLGKTFLFDPSGKLLLCERNFNCSQKNISPQEFLFSEKVNNIHSVSPSKQLVEKMEEFFVINELSLRAFGLKILFEEKNKVVDKYYFNILRNFKIDSHKGDLFTLDMILNNSYEKDSGNIFLMVNFFNPGTNHGLGRQYIIREKTKQNIYINYESPVDDYLILNVTVISYLDGAWKLDYAKLFREEKN